MVENKKDDDVNVDISMNTGGFINNERFSQIMEESLIKSDNVIDYKIIEKINGFITRLQKEN